MRAVLTVVGKDTVGILAKVSSKCAEHNVNICDVTQTILRDLFCMIMLCDIDAMTCSFSQFSDSVTAMLREMGLSGTVMHEDIFNAMHTV